MWHGTRTHPPHGVILGGVPTPLPPEIDCLDSWNYGATRQEQSIGNVHFPETVHQERALSLYILTRWLDGQRRRLFHYFFNCLLLWVWHDSVFCFLCSETASLCCWPVCSRQAVELSAVGQFPACIFVISFVVCILVEEGWGVFPAENDSRGSNRVLFTARRTTEEGECHRTGPTTEATPTPATATPQVGSSHVSF